MSSIKDSLAQSFSAGAGELAQNLFDRLKKNRSDSSSNLISTFANNIEKKLSSSSKLQISLSKLLDEDEKNDEPEFETLPTPELKLEKSQSEINITAKKPITTSISLNSNLCIENETIEPPKIDQVEPILVENPEEPVVEKVEVSTTPTPTKETPAQQLEENPILKKKYLIFSIFVFLLSFFIYNVSYTFLVYLGGLLTGLSISGLLFYALVKLDFIKYFQVKNVEISEDNELKNNVQCLLIQSAVRKENKNFDGVYKGWMNELRENYAPEDYFINKTRSVYINLDGGLLRLQTTSSRVPKRAVADEKIGQINFNELRLYDLTDCQVSLLPQNLCRKRYWSKKYPICLKNVKQLNNKADSLSEPNDSCLVLFARTDREKEDWYNLFRKSSSKQLPNSSSYRNSKNIDTPKRLVSQSSLSLKYDVINDKIVYKINAEQTDENTTSDLSVETQTEESFLYDSSLTFMNTFLIRIFADFFYNKHWINQVQTKIQNKLNKIKIPYFMEDLLITGVDLGSVVPLIKQTSEPWYDEKGLWVHLDIDYKGGIQMSLATKLNLMKLKSDDLEVVKESKRSKKNNSAIEKSSEEDSPESSGDEYVHSGFDEENKLVETANPSKKFLSIINKIAASNYFQKAAEIKYIKKAMENVSNCQLLLNVEVKKITGTIALNIPPHPSDRVWYGFVSKPKIDLLATPQVGEKEVSYSAISDFIADKLKQEFQKVLVFPNMDDFYIPILNSEVDKK